LVQVSTTNRRKKNAQKGRRDSGQQKTYMKEKREKRVQKKVLGDKEDSTLVQGVMNYLEREERENERKGEKVDGGKGG